MCNSYSLFWNYSHLCSIYKILALVGSLVRAKGKLWSSIKLDQEESSPTHCSDRNYQVVTLQDWTKAHVFWGWACQGLNTPTGCALHLHWACTVCARSYPCKLASDTSSWRRAKRSQIKEWSLPPFAWELLLCSGYCSWGTPQPRQSLATFLPDPNSLTWLPGFTSDLPYHWELSRSLLGCGWPLLLMPDHSLPPPWSQPLLPAPLPQQRILSLAACSDCTLKSMESSPDKEYCRAGMIPIIILLNGEMRARATWILFSLSFLQSPGEDKMKTNKQKKIPNTSSVLHDCLFPPGFLWNFKFLNLRKSKNVTRFLLDGQFMTVSVALLVNLNAKSWLSYQIEPYTALHTPAYISVSEHSCWNTVGSKYRRAHLKIWCRALCGKQKPPEDCNLLQWFWCYYTFNIISARSLCYGKFLANSMKIKGSTFSKDSFRE